MRVNGTEPGAVATAFKNRSTHVTNIQSLCTSALPRAATVFQLMRLNATRVSALVECGHYRSRFRKIRWSQPHVILGANVQGSAWSNLETNTKATSSLEYACYAHSIYCDSRRFWTKHGGGSCSLVSAKLTSRGTAGGSTRAHQTRRNEWSKRARL